MSWPVRNAWTTKGLAALDASLKRNGGDWDRVALEFPGRTAAGCKQAYNTHQRKVKLAASVPAAATPKRLKSWQDQRAKAKAAEAERLAVLAHQRSLTSELLGDPLPGRSALDKKRAGIADEVQFDRRVMHVPKKPTLFTGEAR